MSFKSVSKYIVSYINTYGNDEMLKKWNEKLNEKEFKKLFKNDAEISASSIKNKSSYILYSNAERENIKTEGLTFNNKEIISELAKRWKKVKTASTKEDKQIFEKFTLLAEEDKERYNIENGKNKSKVKKNMSGYMYYCISERENTKKEDLKLNNKEIITELARRWKVVKNSDKKNDKEKIEKFNAMAEKDKDRYLSEKESIKESIKNVNIEEVEKVPETVTEAVPEPQLVPVSKTKKVNKKKVNK